MYLYGIYNRLTPSYKKDKLITEAKTFNFTFRYIDDVLSINIPHLDH